jgi:hypothetical protein
VSTEQAGWHLADIDSSGLRDAIEDEADIVGDSFLPAKFLQSLFATR